MAQLFALMKNALLLLACLVTLSHALVAEDGPADERATWEARIKKVQPGMTRAEVEKILPYYVAPAPAPGSGQLLMPYSGRVTTGTGSRQVMRYYVSPGWCVLVCYDYTGVTPENSKDEVGYQRPENKVLAPVILEYQPEPAAKSVPAKVKAE